MKHTLLSTGSCPQVLSRIEKLLPDTLPLWGEMSVHDMMFHCAVIHEEIMKGKENSKKATFKQKLLRTLVLRALKQLPKGIQTKKQYIRPKEDNTAFEAGKNRLIDSINSVVSYQGDIYGSHPFFGPLQTSKWRRFMYMHLDYHLRQFNV